jgi:hypothetical protein
MLKADTLEMIELPRETPQERIWKQRASITQVGINRARSGLPTHEQEKEMQDTLKIYVD